MRINVFFLCVAGLTLPVFADEKLPLLKVGSQTYSNVTVTTVSATDIYFISSQGMGNAKLKDLDPALQKHFHYDPAKVRAAEQKPRTGAALYQQLPVQAFSPRVIEITIPINIVTKSGAFAPVFYRGVCCFCFHLSAGKKTDRSLLINRFYLEKWSGR